MKDNGQLKEVENKELLSFRNPAKRRRVDSEQNSQPSPSSLATREEGLFSAHKHTPYDRILSNIKGEAERDADHVQAPLPREKDQLAKLLFADNEGMIAASDDEVTAIDKSHDCTGDPTICYMGDSFFTHEGPDVPASASQPRAETPDERPCTPTQLYTPPSSCASRQRSSSDTLIMTPSDSPVAAVNPFNEGRRCDSDVTVAAAGESQDCTRDPTICYMGDSFYDQSVAASDGDHDLEEVSIATTVLYTPPCSPIALNRSESGSTVVASYSNRSELSDDNFDDTQAAPFTPEGGHLSDVTNTPEVRGVMKALSFTESLTNSRIVKHRTL